MSRRPCFGRVTVAARVSRQDPYRRGLVAGFLCAAVPAALAFLLCLTFP